MITYYHVDGYRVTATEYAEIAARLLPQMQAKLEAAEAKIAEARREGAEQALRETADAFQVNGWSDLVKGPMREALGNAQRVTDWLRDCADKIAKGEQ